MTEIEKYAEAPVPAPSARTMSLVTWAEEARAATALANGLSGTAFAGAWKNDPQGAAAAILKGSELGLTPVTALAAFDNIQGTPAPKAITLRALVQSFGHGLRIVEETETRAVAEYRRAGEEEWSRTDFTIEEAKQMNLLGKDNWKKQPRNMLVARVTSKAARLVASDVILGIGYSAEELRDHQNEGQQRPASHTYPPGHYMRAEQVEAPKPTPQGDDELLDVRSDLAKAMFAAINAAGIEDADRLDYCSGIARREIGTSGDLTAGDARAILRSFEEEAS